MEEINQAEPYAIPTPQQTFSSTLAEQLEELKTNELMIRFAKSRERLAADPYRPAYHFVSPESSMNDPNAIIFWRGRWHLFFIAMPPDEFPRSGGYTETLVSDKHRTCRQRRLGALERPALRDQSGDREGVLFGRHVGRR